MVASLQIGTQAAYYISEYYNKDSIEIRATWFSPKGSFDIVDGSLVDTRTFERLHAGLGKDGRSLLTTTGRKVEAADVTFSNMKSISLAYGLTSDVNLRKQIITAHLSAVRAALSLLNDESIVARRGKAGHLREVVSMTAALFTHDSARPEEHADGAVFADCSIHTHSVIMALAERADKTIGSIDTRLGQSKMLCGSVYHSHLAHNMRKIGFRITQVGHNGIFEIEGIDPILCAYFSARRQRIVDTLAESGLQTAAAPKLAAAAALSTRQAKRPDAERDRFADWQDRAGRLGFDPTRIIENLRRDGEPAERPALFPQRLARIPRELTEHEATFNRLDLLRAIAVAHVGTDADPSRIQDHAASLIADGHIVAIERGRLEPVYSTPEMILLERQTADAARDLAHGSWKGIDHTALAARADACSLTREQTDVALALANRQALAFLEGRAGTGKTRTLQPIIEQLEFDGYRVIAAAPSWRTARMLRDDLGVEARAIDSWLAISRSGGNFIDARTVVLVDEAGLLGVHATHALLDSLRTARAASDMPKVVMIGDLAQLAPIAAGSGLDLVTRHEPGVRLESVLRQRDPQLRRAVERLAEADIEAAYGELQRGGALVECPDARSAVHAAIDRWFASRAMAPDQDHLLLARTHATIGSLNAEVRRRLRARGELIGPDIVVAAATPSGGPQALHVAVGDRLRIGQRVDTIGRGVINGTIVTVTIVQGTAAGHATITGEIEGESVTFHTQDLLDRRGNVRLGHEYATSIYSAQGLTSETCVLLADTGLDRRDLYVGASRSRGATTVVIDRAAVDARLRVERVQPGLATPVDAEERRQGLIRAWSRLRRKSSTLQHLASAGESGISDYTQQVGSGPDRRRHHDRSARIDHAR